MVGAAVEMRMPIATELSAVMPSFARKRPYCGWLWLTICHVDVGVMDGQIDK